MPFVVDASVSATWLLSDESSQVATVAFARLENDHAVVPTLWWFEVRNLLIINERRRRIDRSAVERALGIISTLPIDVDTTPDESIVLSLARAHGLTVYDAAYLELAVRRGLSLATNDRELIQASKAVAVPLLG